MQGEYPRRQQHGPRAHDWFLVAWVWLAVAGFPRCNWSTKPAIALGCRARLRRLVPHFAAVPRRQAESLCRGRDKIHWSAPLERQFAGATAPRQWRAFAPALPVRFVWCSDSPSTILPLPLCRTSSAIARHAADTAHIRRCVAPAPAPPQGRMVNRQPSAAQRR